MAERWSPAPSRDGQFDERFDGYELTGPISEMDRQVALAAVQNWLRPAPRELCGQELARLQALTQSRAQSAEEMRAKAAAFIDELSQYPADVVVNTCRKWGRMGRFFPSWSELKDLLDFRMRKRLALRRVLTTGNNPR